MDPTALLVALVLFLGGVLLLALSADRLTGSLVTAASAAGTSSFLLAVLVVAVDPGVWGFGVAAVLGGSPGVAVGSTFGAAYFLLGAALPAAALVSPFEVELPGRLLAPGVAAPAVLYPFLMDGRLATWEGAALMALFAPGLWWLYRAEAGGGDGGDAAVGAFGAAGDSAASGSGASAGSSPEEPPEPPAAREAGAAVLYLGGVAAGSWLAARGAGDLAAGLGLDGTAFGATFVGLVLSLEGVLLVLLPVRRGRPEVAAGALVAGLLFYATAAPGLLALAAGAGGLELSPSVPSLHGPALAAGSAVAALFLWRGRMTRGPGAALMLLYLGLWIVAWLPTG